MPSKNELNLDLIKQLRENGTSYQALANRFGVSKSTIHRITKPRDPDNAVLNFAVKIQRLAAEAPDEYCRKEIHRAVLFLRTQQAASKDSKYQKIFSSINAGAREIEEITEDCGYRRDEVLMLLGDLIGQGKVETRTRGGILNRGRKMKLHYYIKRTTQPTRGFDLSFPPANKIVPMNL